MVKELIRTFIAIELPEEIKAAMAGVQAVLRKSGADVGWTRSEGIHLTLKFLGPVDADIIPGLAAALQEAVKDEPAFALGAAGIGCFPTARSPRVVWLGLAGETDALARLAGKVEAACGKLGFKPEGRPFKPHLTLGRVRSPRGRESLMRAMAPFEKVELGEIRAASISVMKSELKPSGAVYTEMHRVELKIKE